MHHYILATAMTLMSQPHGTFKSLKCDGLNERYDMVVKKNVLKCFEQKARHRFSRLGRRTHHYFYYDCKVGKHAAQLQFDLYPGNRFARATLRDHDGIVLCSGSYGVSVEDVS